MDFRILDTEFNPVDTLDQYESIIWTARFVEAGDFELCTPVSARLLNAVKIGYYLFCDTFYYPQKNMASLMIIESMEITSDPESGNKIKITGRDLKSLLDRRIIWGQKTFTTGSKVYDMITTIMNENVINPQDWSKTYQDSHSGSITISVPGSIRKIPKLIMRDDNGDDYPVLDADAQYDGDTIYDVLVEHSTHYQFGWEVLYDFNSGDFVFGLRNQEDHTYDQIENNPLIFSPSFENLKNSNYIESSATEKNSGLITGEGDENNVMYNVIGNEYSGLARKEIHIGASDVSRKEDDGTEYGNAQYLSMLLTKAKNELEQHIYTQTYEGTAEPTRGYVYLQDYNIGDVCEIINEWGISSKVLISEVVMSISTSNISTIPTFSAVDQGGE